MVESWEDEDEIFEDQWVEICDIEGHRKAVRHLANIHLNEKKYILLGMDDSGLMGTGALMLIREERTADGAPEYVISNNEQEVEDVMSRFAERVFSDHLGEQFAEEWDDLLAESETMQENSCMEEHEPNVFCYCGDPMYLQ